MPLFYDNSILRYSEAEMTLSYPRDWTENGVGVLSLWFRGNPAGFLEEPAGTYTITASGTDIGDMTDEFRYAFKQLSGAGSIVARVESVVLHLVTALPPRVVLQLVPAVSARTRPGLPRRTG